MIQHWFEKHRELQKQRAEEGFDGFTLIELLIVIVVLGILAATVIFALGGVTGQSAVAACNSDAKSVEVAIEAWHSYPGNTSNSYPNTIQQLVNGIGGATPTGSGKLLHAIPNNQHYAIGLVGDTTDGGPGGTVGDGTVYVLANVGQGKGTVAGINYDSTTNPCAAVT